VGPLGFFRRPVPLEPAHPPETSPPPHSVVYTVPYYIPRVSSGSFLEALSDCTPIQTQATASPRPHSPDPFFHYVPPEHCGTCHDGQCGYQGDGSPTSVSTVNSWVCTGIGPWYGRTSCFDAYITKNDYPGLKMIIDRASNHWKNAFMANIKQFRKKKSLGKEKWLYVMMIPGLLYYIIFKYGPMFGLTMAFQEFNVFLGFFRSPFVGLDHFKRFFSEPTFGMLFTNTLIFGLMNIFIYFPIPIILALLLNEIRIIWFKRFTQTLVYIPHFISWVVICSITNIILTVDDGIVNNILVYLGREPIRFLTSAALFRPLIMMQIIWKESGWGTIIFLAALSSIDPELYFAAEVDGASRGQKLWYITLPGIRSTIVILLILRLGHFLNTGFEQLLLMINPLNRSLGEVFDTYVYTTGILGGQFSYTAAVGFFKSTASLILVVLANFMAKKFGEDGIY
jgi:putative aldouronate transport system permease protein